MTDSAQPSASILWIEMEGGNSLMPEPDAPIVSRLLPGLQHLIHKLAADRKHDDAKFIDVHWRLGMLPYSLTGAYRAYLRYAGEARKLAEEYENSASTSRLLLAAHQTYDLCFAIDSFLESARRTQNALTAYLSAATKQSLPNSLSDLMKGLESGKYSLSGNMVSGLAGYWNGCGKSLKDYRDLAQHHALVASDVTMFRREDGAVGLNVLLPSNPEAGLSQLAWGDPPVHAQAFLKHQTSHLVGIASFVTRMLLAENFSQERKYAIGRYPRLPMRTGVPINGYRPQQDDEVEATCIRAARTAEQFVASLFPNDFPN